MGADLLQDLRFGLRMLMHRPTFALTAVTVLALGIGAPTTVFTWVNRIFLESPAGVVEPHRLVGLYRSWAPGQGGGSFGNPDYVYYRERATTLSGLAASGGSTVAAFSTAAAEAGQLTVTHTSDNWFDVLGVRPHLGRFFAAEENASPGTHAVVILAHGFWSRALGADPGAVGRTITLNGTPFTVVGVAPPAFRGLRATGEAPDAWTPIATYGVLARPPETTWWERQPSSRTSWLTVVGRLAPGVTFEAAEANLTALSAALDYPGRDAQVGVMLTRQVLHTPGDRPPWPGSRGSSWRS